MAYRSKPEPETLVLKRRLVDQANPQWWLWLALFALLPVLLIVLLAAAGLADQEWDGATWRQFIEVLRKTLDEPDTRDFVWQGLGVSLLSAVGVWGSVTLLPRQRLVLTHDSLTWRLPLPDWLPVHELKWTVRLEDIVSARLIKPPFGASGAMSHLELAGKGMPRQFQVAMWVREDHVERERSGLFAMFRLMRQQLTPTQLLVTPLCEGLQARGIEIDPLGGPRTLGDGGFKLESNPATLAVTVAVLGCLVYTPLDLMLFAERYATTPPYGWMVICGLGGFVLAGAYLVNSEAPRAIAFGLAVMLGIGVGAASGPGMLRVNAWTDQVGIQNVTYYRVGANRFAPLAGGDWPEIELPQPDYWFFQEEDIERQISIRRGGLGFCQIDLANIIEELRNYNLSQRGSPKR